MPTVSVIIPVFQAVRYLKDAVASIQNQTLRDLEIILVDDGSTDGSGELCDQIAEADSRVRVIHQENRGLGPARNAGLDAAVGEYLYYCDADDWAEPDLLADNYALACQTRAAVVVFGAFFETITPSGETIQESVNIPKLSGAYSRDQLWKILPDQGVISMIWARLFRRAFLLENHIRTPDMVVCEDTGVLYAAYGAPFRAFAFNQKAYYHYIRRPRSLTRVYRPRYAEDMYAGTRFIEQILRKEPGDLPWLRGFISRQYMIAVLMVMNNMAESSDLPVLRQGKLLKEFCRKEGVASALKNGKISDMRDRNMKILFCLLCCRMYLPAALLGAVKKRRANRKRA